MQDAATQAMPLRIVEERQRSRCSPAAAPKCIGYFMTDPKYRNVCGFDQSRRLALFLLSLLRGRFFLTFLRRCSTGFFTKRA